PARARTSTVPSRGVESRALASRSANRWDSSAAVPRTIGRGGTSSSMWSEVPVPSNSVRAISIAPSSTAVRSTLSAGRSRRRRARGAGRRRKALQPQLQRAVAALEPAGAHGVVAAQQLARLAAGEMPQRRVAQLAVRTDAPAPLALSPVHLAEESVAQRQAAP